MSARVQPLLDPNSEVLDPSQATCAIFYSITNCQQGLRGVSFGNLLLKQVIEDLSKSFPRVRTYATLSPMPGFCKWLMNDSERPPADRTLAELGALVASIGADRTTLERGLLTPHRDTLVRLGAYYLTEAKHGRAPFDTVARFHLANGACLKRLNWMGDTSETGMRRSLGLMVNYVYRLTDLERNHEAYANHYRIAASRQVRRLAQQSLPASLTRAFPRVGSSPAT